VDVPRSAREPRGVQPSARRTECDIGRKSAAREALTRAARAPRARVTWAGLVDDVVAVGDALRHGGTAYAAGDESGLVCWDYSVAGAELCAHRFRVLCGGEPGRVAERVCDLVSHAAADLAVGPRVVVPLLPGHIYSS
jgi:hypothetical protein